MAIAPVSNVLPLRTNGVTFGGKNDIENEEINYQPSTNHKLKKIPVVVMLAMSPAMLNAGDNANSELLAQLNSMNAVEMYQNVQGMPKIIGTKSFPGGVTGSQKINMISVDGNDNNFEELEFIKEDGEILQRGIIKAVLFSTMSDGRPAANIAGLALPKDNSSNYNINDVRGQKLMLCMIAGPAVTYIKNAIESGANSAGITVCNPKAGQSPRMVVSRILNSEVQKYKENHNLP